MLWLYLTAARSDLLDGKPRRLLHFAPEPAFQRLLQAKSNIEYVSADLDSPLADHQVDIQDLPFPDESFDALLCLHVLEHVEDDRRAMRELWRVLRHDGWAIIMVPLHGGMIETLEDAAATTPEQRLRAYGQANHLRLYGLDYADRLREAGFEVEAHAYATELGGDATTRFVLSPEKVYLCSCA